jgi:hypothetical protein
MDGTQPDARPDVQGASRGTGDPQRDADRAGGGRRAEGSTEYAANAEPGPSADHGYVEGGPEAGNREAGADHGTAANLDPHEPPGQG